MADDDKQDDPALRYLKLSTAAFGTLNVIGGATIGRAWLYDIGLRYYDALGSTFGLPPGTFALSDGRLISTGWELTLKSSLFAWAILVLTLPVVAFLVIWLLTKIEERRRALGGERDTTPMSNLEKLRLYASIAGALFAFGLLMIINATVVLPQSAVNAGSRKSVDILEAVAKNGCAECRIYGGSKSKGLPITSDTRAIYVAGVDGTVSAVPLTGLVVVKLPKPAPVPVQSAPLRQAAGSGDARRRSTPAKSTKHDQ